MSNKRKINLLTLKIIKRKFFEILFEIRALILHVINNNFILPIRIKKFNKIHFGSGNDIKADFLNVDFNSSADIFLDVRNKLNIKSNSIDFIYSCHLVEHLDHEELVAHLKECHRILKKDAVLRLGIPTFEKVFHAYCNQDDSRFIEIRGLLSNKLSIPENLICRMDWINRSVHEFGNHKICLDWEKIRNLLIFSGFEKDKIIQTDFKETIDNLSRKNLTFYVEAIK